MKGYYEEATKTKLTRRMPVIIRLDGCHFHTFTRGMKKPFDAILIKTMQDTMKYLCENIQGCVLGYTQSDEISLLLVDYKELNTSAWFDNEVLKIASVSASLATLAFNKFYAENIAEMAETEEDFKFYAKKLNQAYFDSRVFNIPESEVTNYFYWRQKDAERNSVNSLAQSLFSHKSLQGLSVKDVVTKLEQEKGIIWGNIPTTHKRGCCCIKNHYFLDKDSNRYELDNICTSEEDGTHYVNAGFNEEENVYELRPIEVTLRSEWVVDEDIPQFKDSGRIYIENII